MARIDPIGLNPPPELLRASGRPPELPWNRTGFADALSQALGVPRNLTYSAHARQRLEERGIVLAPADKGRLERAVDDAARKGALESLLILDRAALVVSVPNRTVITVMEPDPATNLVVTNIDSVVVVGA